LNGFYLNYLFSQSRTDVASKPLLLIEYFALKEKQHFVTNPLLSFNI